MNIDDMEGAELDRLCFDLGLAPDWVSGVGGLLGKKYLERMDYSEDRYSISKSWSPSTNIAQAVEMAEEHCPYFYVESIESVNRSHCRQFSGFKYSISVACTEYQGYEHVEGYSYALTLTRACCKAVLARKETNEH